MHINKFNFNITKKIVHTKMNKFKNKKVRLLIFSLCIILIDQISKFLVYITLGFESSKNIIPHLLDFTLVKNTGAAFSLFSNSTSILTIISFVATLLLITIILKLPIRSHWNSIGFAYLLGGTVGNGIDRVFRGYVLDFFELLPINFPIFNVADISINIAIICFIIDIIPRKDQLNKNQIIK